MDAFSHTMLFLIN